MKKLRPVTEFLVNCLNRLKPKAVAGSIPWEGDIGFKADSRLAKEFAEKCRPVLPVGEYPERNWNDMQMSAEDGFSVKLPFIDIDADGPPFYAEWNKNAKSVKEVAEELGYVDHGQPDMQLSRKGKELIKLPTMPGPIYTLMDEGISIDLTTATVVVRDNGEIIDHEVVDAFAGKITFDLGVGKHDVEFEVRAGKLDDGYFEGTIIKGVEVKELDKHCGIGGDDGSLELIESDLARRLVDRAILCKIQREAMELNMHEDARIRAGSDCPNFDALIGPCGHITCKSCHPGNLANHDSSQPMTSFSDEADRTVLQDKVVFMAGYASGLLNEGCRAAWERYQAEVRGE